jgi:hypothetical protein
VIVPDVRVDYSLTRKWAMGVAYSRVGQHRVTGREEIANVDYRPGFVAGTELAASYSGGAIAVTASLFPLPDLFLTKSAVRVSIGAGIGRITTSLEGGPYASVPVADGYHVDVRRRHSTVPAVVAGADWIRFFGRSISSQVGVRYRYVPFTLGAGTISAEYPYYSNPSTLIFGAVPVAIPARRMNAGGFGVGAGMGFHW